MNQANNPRLPAEWEKHDCTIICWPHNKNDWPGKFTPIPWVYAEIVKHILPGEKVYIIVQNKTQQLKVEKILHRADVPLDNIRFIFLQTDRGWLRDSSPSFVKVAEKTKAIRFQFNGWAKYNNWQMDKSIPKTICKKLSLECLDAEYQSKKIVLEGGSIDCNGQGILITTEECLMDSKVQVRNPGFSKNDYENIFKNYFGIKKIIWLAKGIAGDDTHGHVDDLCRFVNEKTVVICSEDNPHDQNYQSLNENIERLQDESLLDGSKIEIVTLPMPKAVIFEKQRLPASYANFYICNHAVLVPTFNDSNDRIALNILSNLFPNREVVGIHALDLVWGLGTIHCLTHEVPL